MRCARCGNENPETNRFCGMCGATLLQGAATQSAPATTASPVAPAARPVPTAGRPAAPAEEAPIISGPSFLGLNQPAASAARSREHGSTDAHATPGTCNLDYLLEDDEAPKRGGAGKFVLILVALALAVGMGYLRWRNQGFGWLTPSASKPSAASQRADANSSSSSGDNASSTPAAPAGAAAQPAGDASSPAGTAGANSTTGTPGVPAGSPAGSAAMPSSPEPDAAAGPAGSQPSSANPPTAANDSGATSSGGADAADQPKPAVDEMPKPAAVIKPAKPADVVAEAQKFIYGKGAPQNCDRGLRLLKPAADHANPKAMIEMGALYSAGLCTPRDLPTAYRWFALALRKEPDNQSVQADLQKLWGEMTQPERQLAMKMSQ